MPDGMERSPSRDRLALIVVWAVGVTLLSCVAWKGWLPVDDGMLAHSAERILQGELPHRDFDAVYTGGLELLHALAFKLFGIKLTSLRTMMLLIASIYLPVFYSLAARALKPLWAGLVTVIAFVWSLPVYFASMPSWHILFLSTFGLATLFRYFDTGGRRWLVATGVLGGLAFLMKSNGLLFAVAVVLSLIFAEQSEAEERTEPSARSSLSIAIWAGCALLGIGLFGLVVRDPGLMAVAHFVVPGLAIATILAVTEWRRGGRDLRARLARWWKVLAPFFLGLALPIALFLIPYLVSGALHSLYVGLFVLPARRLTQVTMTFPPGWTLVWGAPLALLLAFGSWIPPSRVRLASVSIGVLLALVVLFGGMPPNYVSVSHAARAVIPVAVMAASMLLLRGESLTRARRRELFAVSSIAAFVGLLQYPYAAYNYFLYVAPLGVLALAYVVAWMPEAPRPILAVVGCFFAAFGALWISRGEPAYVGKSPQYQPYIVLDVPRGGIEVFDVWEDYVALIDEVQQHSAEGDAIYAAPDLPDVYFLANRRNPTRTMYDLFDEDSGRPERQERILRMLHDQQVKVVVLRDFPLFSEPIAESLHAALRKEYPRQKQIDPFLVMWRP
jgi:hypothetical protein